MTLTTKLFAIAGALFTLAATSQAQLNLVDTDMATSNWTKDTHILAGTGSLGVANTNTGGNPGNALNLTNNFGANSAIATANLHNNAIMTIQPGGLSSVEMSLDTFGINIIMAVGLLVKQGSTYFVADYNPAGVGAWQTISNPNYTSANFREVVFGTNLGSINASHPDFNTVGSQLQFGFLTANSGANAVSITTTFDNFKVNSVPEPATMTLLAIPAIAFLRKRKSAQK